MDPRTVPPPVSLLPLFAVDYVRVGTPVNPPTTITTTKITGTITISHDHTEGPSAVLKARLVEIATELLLDAGEFGVTFGEVRLAAETRGLLTGHEYGRWLSCGDGLMRQARGKRGRTNGKRKSRHGNSHRRMLSVHVHERFAK